MIYLAALLSGFGGLLLEIVLVRRHGLLLGNTAEATTAVLGIFLAGLGIGGLLAPRLPLARARPVACAALLYGAVAVLALLGDHLLASLGAVDWALGTLLVLVVPGVPTLLMGAAFPLLFTAIGTGPARTGALIAANLAGSVLATAVGANFAVPEIGLSWSACIAAAAYSLAALLLAGPARRQPAPPALPTPPIPRLGSAAWVAFAAGGVVLGYEIVLLRRLPFFLEGFQPTLSGVLTACLLALTLGAAILPALLHRIFGAHAALWALVAGALATCVGLHEHLVPDIARFPVGSDVAMHARILLAASVAAAPACLLLGAVVPLCLAPYQHRETRGILAGRLFFWQGVGALAGALLVGHVAPRVAPRAFFVIAPALLTAVFLLPLARRSWLARLGVLGAIATAAAGWSGPGFAWAPGAPVYFARYASGDAWQPIAHRTDSVTTASVVYDRRRHSMMLFTDEFRTAETGPGYGYMKVLGHLPLLLHPSPRRLAVVAMGTATTARAVLAWPQPEQIHAVEISPAVLASMHHFAGDGPLHSERRVDPLRADARVALHATDGRRFLARAAPASLDVITMEPLLPYAPGTVPLYTREFYALARRALADDGLMVQWVPTHAMPGEYFRTLLATFARSFAHHSVWLVDRQTLLIGSQAPHLPRLDDLEPRLAAAPEAARAGLHDAGLPRAVDVSLAFVADRLLATLGGAPDLRDDRPFLERVGYWSGPRRLGFLSENLRVLIAAARSSSDAAFAGSEQRPRREARLRAALALEQGRIALMTGDVERGDRATGVAVAELARLRVAVPESTLLHGEETRAWRQRREHEVVRRSGRGIAAVVRRQLDRDLGSALLQACLGLPTEEGAEIDLRARAAAVERAVSVNPLLFENAPAFLAPLRPASVPRSPLEDLDRLPAGTALVAALATGDVRSYAWRAAFPVRCGRAFLGAARTRALRPAELAALRPLVDPALLAELTAAVGARGGSLTAEIVPLWRRDLAMPPALAGLVRGTIEDRLALAGALSGRKGAAARAVLADLLLDADLGVRTAAGVTLYQTFRDRIPYDPQWDESRRRKAARDLR